MFEAINLSFYADPVLDELVGVELCGPSIAVACRKGGNLPIQWVGILERNSYV